MHHRPILTVLALTAALGAAGCSLFVLDARYGFALDQVERPLAADTSATVAAAVDTSGLTFEDARVRVAWEPRRDGFALDLLNKTDQELWIDWDNAVLVDHEGYSHAVVPGGAAGLNRGLDSAPVRVLGGARLRETLVPEGNVHWTGEEWRSRTLLPRYTRRDAAAFHERVDALRGARLRILLPLVLGDEVLDYVFGFTITSAGVDARETSAREHL